MTCVVGLLDKGDVWMGADSAGVAGSLIVKRDDSKVFRNGPFLMGVTSSFRMGQLLRYSFVPPKHDDKVSDHKFMCTTFTDAVRKCFKDGGYATKLNENETGGCFLVGYHGKLFEVESDYQVGISHDTFAAVGCGDELAMASLTSTDKTKMNPKTRVMLALKVAEKYSINVCRPFRVMRLRGASA